MVRIANPIYDTAFKFLMEDNEAAKILLSALLKKQVVAVTMRNTEHSVKLASVLKGYRIDFSAKVIDDKGNEEDVCIELQKAWTPEEVMRFRNYLGGQYSDEQNVESDGSTPMHIVAIYLLGHEIEETQEPILCVGPSYTDHEGNRVTINTQEGHRFIRSLTHDVIVVQIPRLAGRVRTHAERILSIFNQNFREANRHILDYEQPTEADSEGLNILVRRLQSALGDSQLLSDIRVEVEMTRTFDRMNSIISEQQVEISKQQVEISKQLNEISKQQDEISKQQDEISKQHDEISKQQVEISKQQDEISKQQDEMGRQKKEIEKQQKEIEQRDKALSNAINALRSVGMTDAQIAQSMGISEDIVKSI